jgi:ureidoglycolate lyase
MAGRIVIARPLTREAFAPYGDVIDAGGQNRFPINSGMTERIHDLATAEAAGPNGRVILSIARGKPYEMPLKLAMVERHPFGSQAFVPLAPASFLVVVCADAGSGPGEPEAFLARAGQGVNYPRGRWHGVLTPLGHEQDFLMVDRAGDGNNLEEFHFPEPYEIRLPQT